MTELRRVMSSAELDFSKMAEAKTGQLLIPAFVGKLSIDGLWAALMQGWMNEAAVNKTLETERVTFWSRSQGGLWTKGETSGNYLALKGMYTDCDQDSLLVDAEPMGPTCHTGATSCFEL